MILYEYSHSTESPDDAPDPYTSTTALLAVRGFGNDPSMITRLLGITPTVEWRVGEPRWPGSRKCHLQAAWNFHTPLPPEASPEDHLESLITLLEPHAATIIECASRFSTRINCCLTHNHAMPPAFEVSAQLLQRIAALNVPLLFECTPLAQIIAPRPDAQDL